MLLEEDEVDLMGLSSGGSPLASLQAVEAQARYELLALYWTTVPRSIREWARKTKGIGEGTPVRWSIKDDKGNVVETKSLRGPVMLARLLGVIGDPTWAIPMRVVTKPK